MHRKLNVNELGTYASSCRNKWPNSAVNEGEITKEPFYFPPPFCVDYIWWINDQTMSSVKSTRVTPCWLSGDRKQSGQIWEGKAISCFFAVHPLGFYLSFNGRVSLMKVKVVCACSVSLGCWFFQQRGEKVDSLLQRDTLFGKSMLVSFNEVSKGPDDFFFFSTSGLFLFFEHYRGDEITDVVLVQRNCAAAHAPLLIIHYLSPLHIYVVKIWQWRFSFYGNWKYLFDVHPFRTGLSHDKQPHNRLVNLYFCEKRHVSVLDGLKRSRQF